eukprot:3005980-Prymnesium_polylepis.1
MPFPNEVLPLVRLSPSATMRRDVFGGSLHCVRGAPSNAESRASMLPLGAHYQPSLVAFRERVAESPCSTGWTLVSVNGTFATPLPWYHGSTHSTSASGGLARPIQLSGPRPS